jgi:hypothetical protein
MDTYVCSITFALKITYITYSMLGGEGGVKREWYLSEALSRCGDILVLSLRI